MKCVKSRRLSARLIRSEQKDTPTLWNISSYHRNHRGDRPSEKRDILFLSLSLTPPPSFTPWLSLFISQSIIISCHRSLSLSLSTLCLFLFSLLFSACTFVSWSQTKRVILVPAPELYSLLPSLSFSSSPFMHLKQCSSSVLMQHHANRQEPSEDTLPLLKTALKAIWLELPRSGCSGVISQLLVLLASQLGTLNIRDGGDIVVLNTMFRGINMDKDNAAEPFFMFDLTSLIFPR